MDSDAQVKKRSLDDCYSSFYKTISETRSFIMGIAIIAVVLFHAASMFSVDALQVLFARFGRWGVEVFFFLSGYGIFHALQKNKSRWEFYTRRIVRIFPAALVAGWSWYILLPASASKLACLFGLDQWYIRSILIFYFLSPYLVKLVFSKRAVLYIALVGLFCWGSASILKAHENVIIESIGGILTETIIWTCERITSFLIGLYMGAVGRNMVRRNMYIWLVGGAFCLLVAVALRYSCDFPVYLPNSVELLASIYIFLGFSMPGVCYGLGLLRKWIPGFMRVFIDWLGGRSLELYLLHMLVFGVCKAFVNIPAIALIVGCVLSVMASGVLHGFLSRFVNPVLFRISRAVNIP